MEGVQPPPLVIQPNLIFCERGKKIDRGIPFVGHGTNETNRLAYESIADDERPILFRALLSLHQRLQVSLRR